MSCEQCKSFVKFDTTGIKEVPCDGMCTNPDPDGTKPHQWIPVMLTHSCPHFESKTESITMPPPLTNSKGKMLSIPEIRARSGPSGKCKSCANWKRDGFNKSGTCWHPDNKKQQTDEVGTCNHYYPRPENKVQPGDIIEISFGDQWQLVFGSKDHVVVKGRDGKEQVFKNQGLRIRKC